MKTAQDALIAHIDAAGLPFERVKAYARELRDAADNPAVLTGLLPACLVLYLDGTLQTGHASYQFDLLVVTRTEALQQQEAAQDGLGLAEQLARYLDYNMAFEGSGYLYTLPAGEELRTQMFVLTSDWTALRIALGVQEVA